MCYFSSEDETSSTVARSVDVFLIEKPKLFQKNDYYYYYFILWCKSHNICQFFLSQMHEVFVLSWLVVPKTFQQLLTIFWIMTFWLGIVLGIIRQTRCIFFWSLLSNILIFSTVSFQMPPPSTPTKRYVLMTHSGPN